MGGDPHAAQTGVILKVQEGQRLVVLERVQKVVVSWGKKNRKVSCTLFGKKKYLNCDHIFRILIYNGQQISLLRNVPEEV